MIQNAQSLVFSCTIPELKMSFVLTGDATRMRSTPLQ